VHDNQRKGIAGAVSAAGVPNNGVSGEIDARLAWMRLYEETRNVKHVCHQFRISKKTFYKWLKRYKQANRIPESLKNRSRRPHHIPRSTPQSVVLLLQQLRRETGYGQRRLKAYLEEKHSIRLSERTIWKIIKRSSEVTNAAAGG
jgi:transposase